MCIVNGSLLLRKRDIMYHVGGVTLSQQLKQECVSHVSVHFGIVNDNVIAQ
jgi:hypothetical protein